MKRSSQRQKGKKGEYDVRDYFRENGFVSHRVPSSGSAHGFPGDVLVKHPNGTSFLIEVKIRKDYFKDIYTQLEENKLTSYSFKFNTEMQIEIAYSFFDLFPFSITEQPLIAFKTIKKLVKMHEWVKGSDYLVVRMDRKPFLFIRYTLLAEKK